MNVNKGNISEEEPTAASGLSEKQELLLMLFHDQECSFFQRRKAKALMSRNEDAQQFYRELEATSGAMGRFLNEQRPSDGLWASVLRGIEEEEQIALWTGEGREDAVLQSEERAPWFDWSKLAWGASGAAVAACMALFLSVRVDNSVITGGSGEQMVSGYEPVSMTTTPGGAQASLVSYSEGEAGAARSGRVVTAQSGASQLSRAAVVAQGQRRYYAAPVFEIGEKSRPVEVDWLRSDGRVRMIAGGEREAPVVWISRRAPRAYVGVAPGANLRSVRQGGFGAQDQPVKILPERIPGAIAVSNGQ